MINSSALSIGGLVSIIGSFLLAFILSILPLAPWVLFVQPQWLALVTIYWIIVMPQRISLGTAWLLGLLLDALYGALLGEHALAMCLVAFATQRWHRQLRVFPLLQQALVIFILILIYQALLMWVQGLVGQLGRSLHWCWLSAASSMLLWPWLVLMLNYWQRRHRIY